MSDLLRILIVDDDHMMAKTIVDILRVKGYEAEAAYSGSEAFDMVKQHRFDCVLTDIKMPRMNGVELYKVIKAVQPDLPVVLMTAYSSDALVEEGLREGALATLTKPLNINLLLSFFSSLRKGRSIVIVDDDPTFWKTLSDVLQNRGFTVSELTGTQGILEMLRPDNQIVLLDMKLKGKSDLAVLKEIRRTYPHLPVVLVISYRDDMSQSIKTAMEIKAYTCLYKPFEIEELIQVLTEIHQQELSRALGKPVRQKMKSREKRK